MASTRACLRFMDKNKRCLWGPKLLTRACSRSPLTSCQFFPGSLGLLNVHLMLWSKEPWTSARSKAPPKLWPFCSVIHRTLSMWLSLLAKLEHTLEAVFFFWEIAHHWTIKAQCDPGKYLWRLWVKFKCNTSVHISVGLWHPISLHTTTANFTYD